MPAIHKHLRSRGHTSSSRRLLLYETIRSVGSTDMDPCSRCRRLNLSCVTSPVSTNCAECVRSKQSCDHERLSAENIRRLFAEKARLESEVKRAAEERRAAQEKEDRLRSQVDLVQFRARRLFLEAFPPDPAQPASSDVPAEASTSAEVGADPGPLDLPSNLEGFLGEPSLSLDWLDGTLGSAHASAPDS